VFTPVGETVYVDAWVVSGGPVYDWVWSWESGGYIDKANWDYFSTSWALYNSPGTYLVYVQAWAEGGWDSSNSYVYVVEVDDIIKIIPEPVEAGPVYVAVDTEVTLKARPYPRAAPYPSGEPHWEVIDWPQGADPSLSDYSDSITTTLSGLTEAGDYVIEAECGDNDPGDNTITVTAVEVTDVVWETYPGNIELVPDNGKYRIFPDKQTPEDQNGADRRKVIVKATLSAPVQTSDNIHVVFRCWDVDDPSSNTAPIDPDDSNPDPNYHSIDNRGSFYFEGGSSFVLEHADSSVVTVIFEVSMQPGDNYRVTATTRDLAPPDLTHYMVDTGNLPYGVKRTPMLTTWRKLWIEQDSMTAVATTGSEMNHVEGTASGYEPYQPPPVDRTWILLGQNLPGAFDDENQFKYGTYVAGTKTYSTRDSTAYWSAEDKVKVKGDPNDDGAPMDYKLYDDDDPNLLPSYPDLATWASVFHAAYIEPSYLPSNYSDQVPFIRNLSSLSVAWGSGTWNDYYDCSSTSDFWTELAVGAFQPQTSNDFDPDTESAVLGAAKVHGDDNQCVLYYETIRDRGSGPSAEQDLAHEIGHGAGIEDNCCEPGCLMWVDEYDNLGDHFCDKCLEEMRKDTNY